jgi:hypothetical protein
MKKKKDNPQNEREIEALCRGGPREGCGKEKEFRKESFNGGETQI